MHKRPKHAATHPVRVYVCKGGFKCGGGSTGLADAGGVQKKRFRQEHDVERGSAAAQAPPRCSLTECRKKKKTGGPKGASAVHACSAYFLRLLSSCTICCPVMDRTFTKPTQPPMSVWMIHHTRQLDSLICRAPRPWPHAPPAAVSHVAYAARPRNASGTYGLDDVAGVVVLPAHGLVRAVVRVVHKVVHLVAQCSGGAGHGAAAVRHRQADRPGPGAAARRGRTTMMVPSGSTFFRRAFTKSRALTPMRPSTCW